jgi:hypothetical protein
MLGDLSRLPVHWIDGMKISRKHFEETEEYLQEQLRDTGARQLAEFSFGLLPADKSLDLNVFCDFSQQIKIELNSCKAVTPNGTRIQVLPADQCLLNTHFKEIASRYALQTTQAQNLYIVLSIDPYHRVPAGEPQIEELPPRHPYTRPTIALSVIPAEQLNSTKLSECLVIGKISFQNGELIFQKEFIPSCTTVNSLPIVKEWHNRFRQLMETWEQCAIRVVQKINSKTQSQQPNSLASSIQSLSEKVLDQLVLDKLNFQWILPSAPPIFLCSMLLKHIQYVYMVLQCYPEKEREEMLAYFAEWTDVQAGTIETQTFRVLQLSYNHYDLQSVLQEILQAYQVFVQIFQKLSQLDFIGKRKGQNIFVIEQQVKETKPSAPPPAEKPSSRWSPLS